MTAAATGVSFAVFGAVLQNEFKAELPCIANCMVIGDKRKFLTILIALRSAVSASRSLF